MKNEIAKSSNNETIKSLFDFYTKNGFGNILKSEIDLFVFNLIIKDHEYLGFDSEINIFDLDKQKLNNLANKLKITQTRLLTIIEKFKCVYEMRIEEQMFIQLLNKNLTNYQPKELTDNGKFRVYIPNRIFKQEIELRLSNLGFVPDYSFNRDILIIDWLGIVYLFKMDTNILKSIIKESVKKFQKEGELKNLELIDELNTDSIELMLMDLATNILNKDVRQSFLSIKDISTKIINHLSKRK